MISPGTEYRGAKEEEWPDNLQQIGNNLLIADGVLLLLQRDLVTGEHTQFSIFCSAETQIKRFRTNVKCYITVCPVGHN